MGDSDESPANSPPANAGCDREPVREASERVDGLPAEWTPELRLIMSRITVAGCLAVVFMEFTASSPRVDMLRAIGASYQQFGIIEAIPLLMLMAQFAGALFVNRLNRRKPLWMVLFIFHRALSIPFALLPYFFPDINTTVLVWSLIGILAISSASAHFGVPLWFSWMSDLLPRRSLGEYWARRRRWMAICSMVTLGTSAWFFTAFEGADIRTTYVIICSIGAMAGIIDIALFWRVPEPKMQVHGSISLARMMEPFLDRNFRPFIFFWSYWAFSATFAFIFFRLYMLKYLEWSVPHIQLLFGCHALGGTLFAARIGRWVDHVGCRPVIVLFTFLKSTVVIGIFLMQPGYTILPLIPIFIFDNFLNTGIFVAQNSYMLKHSPRLSRPMYVAGVMATTGLAGGLAATLSGNVLQSFSSLDGTPVEWLGLTWTHFHVVFAISIALRWIAIIFAWQIHEPKAEDPGDLLIETIVPSLVHWFTFPLGFFSRGRRAGDTSDNSNK